MMGFYVMNRYIKYKIGQKIGGLIYFGDDGYKVSKSLKRHRKAKFKCPYCENIFSAIISNVKKGNHTTSCGCVSGKLRGDKLAKHRMGNHPLYFCWHDLKNRCNNNKYRAYHRYGGRGITVCNEWQNDFVIFKDWALSNGYKIGLVIDRKNNDGNYEPSNCRFITQSENARNTSSNVLNIEKVIRLKKLLKSEKSDQKLGRLFNISRTTVYDVRNGKTWSDIQYQDGLDLKFTL